MDHRRGHRAYFHRHTCPSNHANDHINQLADGLIRKYLQ